MNRLLAVSVVALFAACSEKSTCVPNASVVCPCPGGQSGTQVCLSDGTVSACECTAPDASVPAGDSGTLLDGSVFPKPDAGATGDASLPEPDGGVPLSDAAMPLEPVLEIDRTSLGFGTEFGDAVWVETKVIDSLQVRNGGQAPLTLSNLEVQNAGGEVFKLTSAANLTLTSGQHAVIQVVYAPTAAGSHNGVLQLTSNSTQRPSLSVNLVGSALVGPVPQSSGPTTNPECLATFCGRPRAGDPTGVASFVAYPDERQLIAYPDDRDGDERTDPKDNCPFVANRDQADDDGDGVGNACDDCPAAANKDQRDTDGDGLGDSCDSDLDGDGVSNAADNCPAVPNRDQRDSRAANPSWTNPCPGKGDACCPDADGDGVPNATDTCPIWPNVDQAQRPTSPVPCLADADADGVADTSDDCVDVANPDQKDFDKDGLGDACDADLDGDGVANTRDDCPAVPDPTQRDSDRDGVGDPCDPVFCFVVDPANKEACLAANSPFTLSAGPALDVAKGAVRLPLFANRNGVGIQYTWTVKSQPAGSQATLANPSGWASASRDWQYVYPWGVPSLQADVAGDYELQCRASLVFPDRLYPEIPTATATLKIKVH